MKTTPWYPLCGVAVLLLACSMSASAAEVDKTFPGALCKSQFSTDLTQNLNGSKFNSDSSDQVWTCPIVRDVPADDVTVEFARITVINRHSLKTLTCTLVSRTAEAAFHDNESHFTAGGRDAEPTDLVYGAGDSNSVSGVNGGYYYFECIIPGIEDGDATHDSGIVSYRITENVGED